MAWRETTISQNEVPVGYFFQYSLNTRYYQAVRMQSFSALFGMKTETSTACSVTLDADQALYVNNGK